MDNDNFVIDFDKSPDGLVPAIVTDVSTGQVLMLAYMNKAAYDLTLKTRETWYWSRSRQALWHKGETSGHFQHVKTLAVDCDFDTLLIGVEQVGPACHTGAVSCFFNNILDIKEEYNDQ